MQEPVEMLEQGFERSVTYATIAHAVNTPGESEAGVDYPVDLHMGSDEYSRNNWADLGRYRHTDMWHSAMRAE